MKKSLHPFTSEQGRIQAIGDSALSKPADRVIDGKGMNVSPGWIDLHVHLREPGYEHKETIETGLNCALAGGFTAVCCMPNTEPALDNAATVHLVQEIAAGHVVNLHVIGAATKGRAGKEITELGDLASAGVHAVSDDGSPVIDSGLLRKVMEYGSTFGIRFFSHAEDPSLTNKGAMNEGIWSTTLGMRGSPTIAEDVMVSRDLLLAEYLDVPVHICHVSSARSVELIREAQKRGVKATAEATPHHFALALTDAAIESFSTDLKMSPPPPFESRCGSGSRGVTRRYDLRDRDRSCPPRPGGKGSRIRLRPQRNFGVRDGICPWNWGIGKIGGNVPILFVIEIDEWSSSRPRNRPESGRNRENGRFNTVRPHGRMDLRQVSVVQ